MDGDLLVSDSGEIFTLRILSGCLMEKLMNFSKELLAKINIDPRDGYL